MTKAEYYSGKVSGAVIHTTVPECLHYVDALKNASKVEMDNEKNLTILTFDDGSKLIILK